MTLFDRHSVAGELVVWGESRWVSRLGNFPQIGEFFKRVHSVALAVNRVHQMHIGRRWNPPKGLLIAI